jgi:hypothetical protein
MCLPPFDATNWLGSMFQKPCCKEQCFFLIQQQQYLSCIHWMFAGAETGSSIIDN